MMVSAVVCLAAVSVAAANDRESPLRIEPRQISGQRETRIDGRVVGFALPLVAPAAPLPAGVTVPRRMPAGELPRLRMPPGPPE
jgi:hypothetical protein